MWVLWCAECRRADVCPSPVQIFFSSAAAPVVAPDQSVQTQAEAFTLESVLAGVDDSKTQELDEKAILDNLFCESVAATVEAAGVDCRTKY